MDALDRRIAVALQHHGRATWREVARVVGASETTAARRGRQLLESGVVRVGGQHDPAIVGLGSPVLVQLNCAASATKRVAVELAARPDVRFLAIVTSTFDIVLELIVPSRDRLARVLVEEFSTIEGVTGTTTSLVMRMFKTPYEWSREQLDAEGVDASFGGRREGLGRESTTTTPDAIDLQLIQMLGQDGRRTYLDLANAAGITESIVRRRVSALVEQSYLTFSTIVDPRALGFEIEAFVLLWVDLAALDDIASALAACPEIRYLSGTSGYCDLACEVMVRSPEELHVFTTKALGGIGGIHRVVVAHELVTVKRAYIESSGRSWGDVEPLQLMAGQGT